MATAREQLADMLRQSRIEAGYGSHGALARKLNVSRPVITKAENAAHPVPSDAILAAWAGVTGAPLDTLIELAHRAKSGTPDWFMPYRLAESEADTLRCWSPVQRPVGTSAIMAEQCAHLAIMAERPDVAVHVIPEGANLGLWGGFDLATRDNVTTVCLTTIVDMTSTAGDLVTQTTRAFERMLGAALPRAESLDRIRVAEETWKAQI